MALRGAAAKRGGIHRNINSARAAAAAAATAAAVEPLEARQLFAAGISVTSAFFGSDVPDNSTTPSANNETDLGVSFAGGSRGFGYYDVTNTGDADLVLGNLAVPAGFKIEQDLPAVLGPGSGGRFTVSRLHDAQDVKTGTVSFTTNVPGAETYDFAVRAEVAAMPVDPPDVHENVTSFADQGSVDREEGSDTENLVVERRSPRLLRFNVATGPASLGFNLDGTAVGMGASGDIELLVLRDADGDGQMDLAELNAPVNKFFDPSGGGATQRTYTLTNGTYFALLRVVNFAVTNAAAEPPNVRVDYTLNVTQAAVQPPAVAVTFNGTAVNDGDTTPSAAEGTDFGSPVIGQPAVERTFTVTNTGGQPLTLGQASIAGSGFEILTDLPATLAPGASAPLVLRMLTTSAGTKAGAVSFATNASAQNPFDFSVSGNVLATAPAGEITVTFQGGGLLDGQSQAVDFGAVAQGQPGPAQTFTVKNDGTADLALGAITLPAGFTLTEPLAATLAPGATDTFTVTMATDAVGARTGTLSIASGDADENPFDVPVTGNVTAPGATGPDIAVLLDGVPIGDAQAGAIDFGVSTVGQAGASRTFRVRNDGAAPLDLGPVNVPAGFAVTEPLAPLLGPGGFDEFTVTVQTATGGMRTGTITIGSSDPDENPFDIPVNGVVAAAGSNAGPEITVLLDGTSVASGGAIDFGNAAIGSPAPQRTLTIRNDGTGALTLGQISLPTGYTLVEGLDGGGGATLAPGATDTITVAMSTANAGGVAGEAIISNNDTDEASFRLNLAGNVTGVSATGPVAIAAVTAKVPGTVIAGTRKARAAVAVTLSNTSPTARFAGPVTVSILSSADALPDGADDMLTSVTRNVKLKAGRTRTIKLKVLFPAVAATGTRTLLATALAGGVTEQGVGPAVNVQAPFVHLTGSITPAPAARPLTFDRRARLSVPLTNAGNVPTTRTPATYSLIVSNDGTESGQVFSTTALGRIRLRPGQTRPQRLTVTFPAGSFAAGTYTLIVRLSAELNDANGQTVALIPFTIA